jgi:hypothetical protein
LTSQYIRYPAQNYAYRIRFWVKPEGNNQSQIYYIQ